MTVQTRYLLCRPRGGFTDCMVQLDTARHYAIRHDRTLIVDLSWGGLKTGFETVFEPLQSFGCPLKAFDVATGAQLDAMKSVRPSTLTYRVSTSLAAYKAGPEMNFVDPESGDPLTFDMGRDHPEQLLVHERCGGGHGAIRALRHLRFVPPVADEIVRRLIVLGQDYEGVHIRNSDCKTDFHRFLSCLAPALRNRSVLLCTDSHAVLQAASKFLGPHVNLIGQADIPDMGGAALHERATDAPLTHALDLLTDMMALALARGYHWTHLLSAGTGRSRAVASGYTLLALALRNNPEIIETLLENATPSLWAVHGMRSETSGRNRIRRRLATLDQWRWNWKAKNLALKSRRRVARLLAEDALQPTIKRERIRT